MKVWGFGTRRPKQATKRKAQPAAKRRAVKRRELQTEQPMRPVSESGPRRGKGGK